MAAINKILGERGIESKFYSKFDSIRDDLIKDFNNKTLTLTKIAEKYEYSLDQIRNKLQEYGLYDENRWQLFINKKPYYQCWVDKYGVEEADRREVLYREKQAIAAKNKVYVYRDALKLTGKSKISLNKPADDQPAF